MCELKLSGNRFVMQRAAVFEFIEVCIIITALIVLLAFLKKILVVTAMAAIIALMLFLFFKGRGLKTEFGRGEIVVQKCAQNLRDILCRHYNLFHDFAIRLRL